MVSDTPLQLTGLHSGCHKSQVKISAFFFFFFTSIVHETKVQIQHHKCQPTQWCPALLFPYRIPAEAKPHNFSSAEQDSFLARDHIRSKKTENERLLFAEDTMSCKKMCTLPKTLVQICPVTVRTLMSEKKH